MPLVRNVSGGLLSFPPLAEHSGVAMLAGSFFLFFRSYTDDTFLSPLVRIQEERTQRVVSNGRVRVRRHPMYLRGILVFAGRRLLLGSGYGLLIGLALTVLLIARIHREEEMLARELEGYREYMRKLRYWLVPYLVVVPVHLPDAGIDRDIKPDGLAAPDSHRFRSPRLPPIP